MNSPTTSTCGTDPSWQSEFANLGRNVATSGFKDEEVRATIEIGRTREVDGVAIVDVAGRATLGRGYGRLPESVKNVAGSGRKKILFDLGGVLAAERK